MAIQILPSQQDFASELGTGLGQGFGTGLQYLFQDKLNQLQKARQIQQQLPYFQSLGYSPEEATALLQSDPKVQQEAIKRKLLQPQEQAYGSALQQLLGGGQQQGAEGQAGQQMPNLAETGLNSQQATKLAELGLKQQETKSRENREFRKETAPIREQIANKAKAADETLRTVKEMRKLNDSGKLNTARQLKALEYFGLDDVKDLLNPESERYQKLQTHFLGNLKTVFGSRITNLDVENYLATIPTLMNSKEGRDLIYNDIEIASRAAKIEESALEDILSKNRYISPEDLNRELRKKTESKINDLYEKTSFGETARMGPEEQAGKIFDKLPSAKELPGRRIKFPDGSIRKSDGTKWIKES